MSNTCQRMFAHFRTGVRDNREMESKFVIEKLGQDGPLMDVGPVSGFDDFPLKVPSKFTRVVTTQGSDWVIEVTITFDGRKLGLYDLGIHASKDPITPRELLAISLPKIVRACAENAIPRSEFWTQELPELPNIDSRLRDDLRLLAKFYWFEYITWGSPRVEIQKLLKCQKTTANYYIRLASKLHTLPEARLNENKKATAQPQGL